MVNRGREAAFPVTIRKRRSRRGQCGPVLSENAVYLSDLTYQHELGGLGVLTLSALGVSAVASATTESANVKARN